MIISKICFCVANIIKTFNIISDESPLIDDDKRAMEVNAIRTVCVFYGF